MTDNHETPEARTVRIRIALNEWLVAARSGQLTARTRRQLPAITTVMLQYLPPDEAARMREEIEQVSK